jgi:hypothetical protein
MQTGLAEAWWSRVCDEAEDSAERLAAAHNLADTYMYTYIYLELEIPNTLRGEALTPIK